MNPLKEEFSRLVAIMGWNQSEAARQLHMSPAAVSNLMNPNHPNRPRPTTLQLLKLIVSGEHPDAIEPRNFELRDKPAVKMEVKENYLSARERKLIGDIRGLSVEEQETLYRVVFAMTSRRSSRTISSYRKDKRK